MPLLTWNRACTVGVMAMDDQHGILMDTLNELRLAVLRCASHEEVSQLLERLIEFTRLHFHSEEQLMERFAFPGFLEHREEHQRMLIQIQDSSRRMQHGETLHMRPLLGFLRDCYSEHMSGLDQEYGAFLNDHGIF